MKTIIKLFSLTVKTFYIIVEVLCQYRFLKTANQLEERFIFIKRRHDDFKESSFD